MLIFDVPIEPLEERYSADWWVWFREAYQQHSVPFYRVGGEELTSRIEEGVFLDVYGTNYYKASQLMEIIRLLRKGQVKDGDTFLFHDLWFPGLEMLAYVRDATGLQFKIYGLLHAGTYDPHDFLAQRGMAWWGEPLENSWWRIVDGVFVATHFHKYLLTSTRDIMPHRVHVTGFPIFDCSVGHEISIARKGNLIVFPHRLDPEKNPDKFDILKKKIEEERWWKCIRTKDIAKDKRGYYDLLGMSKISLSFADQETWGIAMQESVFCGCLPLVPDRLSYSELYPREFRYVTEEEMEGKVKQMMDLFDSSVYQRLLSDLQEDLLRKGREAIPNMLRIMGAIE